MDLVRSNRIWPLTLMVQACKAAHNFRSGLTLLWGVFPHNTNISGSVYWGWENVNLMRSCHELFFFSCWCLEWMVLLVCCKMEDMLSLLEFLNKAVAPSSERGGNGPAIYFQHYLIHNTKHILVACIKHETATVADFWWSHLTCILKKFFFLFGSEV